ncbi:MAG: lytic transglycosylase domain-containing protein [Deltaproteobacteria bacterium]|nr:lytic transglycosylase domain-containing protein [Deltaproteobacteria bacterium]
MSDDTLSTLAIAAGAAGVGWWLYQRHEHHTAEQRASAQRIADLVRVATTPVLVPPSMFPASRPAGGAATAAAPGAQSGASSTLAASPLAQPKGGPPPAAAPARTPPIAGPTQPITREFDPIFAANGHGVPVAYLRALAAHESDMHAGISDGPAIGLLQVVDAVRTDHNVRYGTQLTRADLLVPATNVDVATSALRRIIDSYQRNHPAIANLREDWTNLRFVELVTLGWNAGWSERAGLGRVARYLERNGRPAITVEAIVANARAAGVSPHLSDRRKLAFANAVTATYARERVRDRFELQVAAPAVAAAPSAPPNPAPA